MIYLDNAATTLRKPPEVASAMRRALENCGGAGRGGHAAAARAAQEIYQCREAAAGLFHMKDPARVILTANATQALNLAIKGLAGPGARVLISGFEHNAVTRPLAALGAQGVKTVILPTPLFEPEMALHLFEEALSDGGAALCVCIHVSNVFGYVLPVERIAALCRDKGVPLIVDASQSAGILPIEGDSGPIWCMPGHKGLYGPQGTGMLLLPPGMELPPQCHGGTGGNSRSPDMPSFYPDRLEAGTHNAPGAAGLAAGIRFVKKKGNGRADSALLKRAADLLSVIRGVRVYTAPHFFCQTGVVSFTVREDDSEWAADALSEQGIAVRGGLHCAPLAHKTADTFEKGAVRVSLSHFTAPKDIDALARAVAKI